MAWDDKSWPKTLKKLERALKRLEPDQGRIARRNARQAVTYTLGFIRRYVDEVYPAYKKPTERASTAHLSPHQKLVRRKRALRLKGWAPLERPTFSEMENLAAVGVKVQRLPNDEVWAPEWATVFAGDLTKLRKAKASMQERKAMLAEFMLHNEAPQKEW